MNQVSKIRKALEHELEGLKELKKTLERVIKKAPSGSLVISKSNKVTQYFHKTQSSQKKGTYIKKTHDKLISALAQKDYDCALYHETQKRELQIMKALNYLPRTELTDVYKKLTEIRKPLVDSRILSDEEYVKNWQNVPYVGNTYYEGSQMFQTERGEAVRSKSEKIIADKLNAMHVPYRYEYPLHTKKLGTIYPDFMILIVSERKEAYLEHFGMMDDPEYCRKVLTRIQNLAQEGIVLGVNLFATFESSDVPLDPKVLDFLRQL